MAFDPAGLFIPFTSVFNVHQWVDFAGRGQHLRVVVNVTHVCLQKFKLGVLTVLGQRFDAGAWHFMVLPVMFLLTSRKTTDGYSRLMFCLWKRVREESDDFFLPQ